MTRFVCILLLVAALTVTVVPANAAAAAGQEQAEGDGPEARLAGALIWLDLESPLLATVDVYYTFEPGTAAELLVAWFPGQRLRLLEVDGEGSQTPPVTRWAPEDGSAIRRLIVEGIDPEAAGLHLRYTVNQRPDYAFRVPVPVPLAVPDEDTDVQIAVILPPGAEFNGDSFPDFIPTRHETRPALRSETVAVPSFVHVVYDGVPIGADADRSVMDRSFPSAGGIQRRFGANFWGFFLFAAAWCAVYMGWAVWRNRRDRG